MLNVKILLKNYLSLKYQSYIGYIALKIKDMLCLAVTARLSFDGWI